MTTEATQTSPIALKTNALTKEFELKRRKLFRTHRQVLRAVDQVSISVNQGETFGLVGESGCGKSTIARCILRLTEPTSGEVQFDGQSLSNLNDESLRQLRRRLQIVFQDPHASLDPRMSAKQLVAEPLSVHADGNRKEQFEAATEMLTHVGIPEVDVDKKPHAFSGGQRQRIAIARALVLDPELIILDEPVSSLDVSIQAQVINLLNRLQREHHLTYLFIVHDLLLAEYFCDRLAVLYLGAVMELADSETLFNKPLHPYTVSLLSAVPTPRPRRDRTKRILLHGDVDSSSVHESGCRFRSRCPVGQNRSICQQEEPPLVEHETGHWLACHFPGELKPKSEKAEFSSAS